MKAFGELKGGARGAIGFVCEDWADYLQNHRGKTYTRQSSKGLAEPMRLGALDWASLSGGAEHYLAVGFCLYSLERHILKYVMLCIHQDMRYPSFFLRLKCESRRLLTSCKVLEGLRRWDDMERR